MPLNVRLVLSVVTAKTLPLGSISLAVTVPVTVGNFAIVIVDGVVAEFTQVVVEAYSLESAGITAWKSGPPT